jgi:hypothetical protein
MARLTAKVRCLPVTAAVSHPSAMTNTGVM